MSRPRVRRKVESWEDYHPPVEWRGVLECGHKIGDDYEGGISDESKAAIEKDGGAVDCYECGEDQEKIERLEYELKQLKAKRSAKR